VTPSCVLALCLHAAAAHTLQGYGNSQGGGVWRGGNKQIGFDSESLG
jgi:hypothetical protein